jgi:hypothetical protein
MQFDGVPAGPGVWYRQFRSEHSRSGAYGYRRHNTRPFPAGAFSEYDFGRPTQVALRPNRPHPFSVDPPLQEARLSCTSSGGQMIGHDQLPFTFSTTRDADGQPRKHQQRRCRAKRCSSCVIEIGICTPPLADLDTDSPIHYEPPEHRHSHSEFPHATGNRLISRGTVRPAAIRGEQLQTPQAKSKGLRRQGQSANPRRGAPLPATRGLVAFCQPMRKGAGCAGSRLSKRAIRDTYGASGEDHIPRSFPVSRPNPAPGIERRWKSPFERVSFLEGGGLAPEAQGVGEEPIGRDMGMRRRGAARVPLPSPFEGSGMKGCRFCHFGEQGSPLSGGAPSPGKSRPRLP